MSDTMTLYTGEEETITVIDPQPDTENPGKFLIKSPDGKPLCAEFSLKEHAYNIVLPPGSYIIIDADKSEIFKPSSSNDHVIFVLPAANPFDVYIEQYYATIKDTSPHIVLALRYQENNRLISAVLYPRDLERVPKPFFMAPDGKSLQVKTKGMDEQVDLNSKVEYAHYPIEIELITNAIYKPAGKTVAPVDPNAPKEEWI